MIQSEFQKLPVNTGSVSGQPSPHTLRGAETNFYANTSEQQFDVMTLGQKAHIVATPVEYSWNYGDGTVVGPQQSVGGPLPEDGAMAAPGNLVASSACASPAVLADLNTGPEGCG